tara:strand:- start:298 stop:1146 length:849 start_codon:yes stop_codon:yes gene_type:complete
MAYPSYSNTDINSELFANLVTAAQFAAYENSVARQLVTVFDAPMNTGKNLQVPIWAGISASIIADESAATALTSNTSSAIISLAEHVTYHKITDMLRDSAYQDVMGMLGDQSGRAIAESMDKQVFAEFANLSADLGGTGFELTVQTLLQAAAQLRTAKLTGPFFAVVHPGAAYNLKKALTATTAYTANTNAGNRVLDGFYVGSVAGIQVYESALVATSGNDATCAVFASTAIGHAMRGSLEMETQRQAKDRATDLVVKAVAGAKVLQPTHGVIITADVRTSN